jgi:hypothetical protein
MEARMRVAMILTALAMLALTACSSTDQPSNFAPGAQGQYPLGAPSTAFPPHLN